MTVFNFDFRKELWRFVFSIRDSTALSSRAETCEASAEKVEVERSYSITSTYTLVKTLGRGRPSYKKRLADNAGKPEINITCSNK